MEPELKARLEAIIVTKDATIDEFEKVVEECGKINRQYLEVVSKKSLRIQELEMALKDCMSYVEYDNLTMQSKHKEWDNIAKEKT